MKFKDELEMCSPDVSHYFDDGKDEEAVDALLCLGGNPSTTRGATFAYNRAPLFAHRNILRRLYHGATGLEEEDLERTWKFMSRQFCKETRFVSHRRGYYLGVEKQKLDFWAKYMPSLFSHEPCQSESIEGGMVYMEAGPGITFYRPAIALQAGKVLKKVYMKKYPGFREWEQAELVAIWRFSPEIVHTWYS